MYVVLFTTVKSNMKFFKTQSTLKVKQLYYMVFSEVKNFLLLMSVIFTFSVDPSVEVKE